ncbi:MAG: hypothetical protein ACREIT_08760, partial [Tepidisphaeraceae bacterium]
MQLTQSTSMRQEMRQLLTPRMIQSMEILQLPLMALEERIEQELQANPVLEQREGNVDEDGNPNGEVPNEIADQANSRNEDRTEDERALVVKENTDQAEDFERLARIGEYLENEEWANTGPNYRQAASYDGERDKKLDAMNNTAARGITLAEHLLGQWAFVECPSSVRRAGEVLINYLDAEGYLRTEFEAIQKESKRPVSLEDLQSALLLIQTLEPAGVGARNLQECLLLQLDALEADSEDAEGHDFDLERMLITDHLKDLEMNRYPQISKKLARPIADLQAAVKRLGRLNPYPGKQIGGEDAPLIMPD